MSTLGLIWAVLAGSGCTVQDVEALPDADDEVESEFRNLVIVTKPDVAEIPAPLPAAHCSIKVIGQTNYDIESNYLPRTVWCENGGADFEALKAQAIAARSVVYYEAELDGSICDSESCQHASCIGNSAAETLAQVPEEVFRAVNETSGMYLTYDDTLTYAFYVAGSKSFHGQTCIGTDGGAPTEHWVTYNNGKDGTAVEQTKLGSVFNPSDNEYGQNRGCMSQWGARCLEEAGSSTLDILQFYYGSDIEVVQATGECVEGGSSLGEPAECGDGRCNGTETEDSCARDCEPCGTVAAGTTTIIDESDGCFGYTGDDEFVRSEEGSGHEGSYLWTESTEHEAHTNGKWTLSFAEAGNYKVEAFIERGAADEGKARYRVIHNGDERFLRVNQARAEGWVELGVFDFEAGQKDQSITLTDLSGERGNKIVFDAVRISPASDEDEDKFDDVDMDTSRGTSAGGCSVSGEAPLSAPAWMLVALVAWRRRRARARR